MEMQWAIAAGIIVLILTAAAAAIILVLGSRKEKAEVQENYWRVELWNIRCGYRIVLRFEHSMVVGRTTVCGFSADGQPIKMDYSISREHILLYEQEGRLWIWNLSNTNPAMVNDQQLNAPWPLQTGYRLELGNSEFLVTRAGMYQSK